MKPGSPQDSRKGAYPSEILSPAFGSQLGRDCYILGSIIVNSRKTDVCFKQGTVSCVIVGEIDLASLMLSHRLLQIKQPITFKEQGVGTQKGGAKKRSNYLPKCKGKNKLFIRKILEFGQFHSLPLIQM